jgi:hypothetical protein
MFPAMRSVPEFRAKDHLLNPLNMRFIVMFELHLCYFARIEYFRGVTT